PLQPADIPAILALYPGVLRVEQAAELEKHLFKNPYFTSDAMWVLRDRRGEAPLAVSVLISEPTYADPRQVDPSMPCYRLGAFGTETMSSKRIKGLFSFLARPDQSLSALGLDLLGQATLRLSDDDDIHVLAAQAPSDAPALLRFYERNFRRQG